MTSLSLKKMSKNKPQEGKADSPLGKLLSEQNSTLCRQQNHDSSIITTSFRVQYKLNI